MVTHDSHDRREPEASPFAMVLGGEKRIEDSGQDVGGNSSAGIGNEQHYVRPGFRVWTFLGLRQAQFDIVGRESELSTLCHRIEGIDEKVQKGLMKLSCI